MRIKRLWQRLLTGALVPLVLLSMMVVPASAAQDVSTILYINVNASYNGNYAVSNSVEHELPLFANTLGIKISNGSTSSYGTNRISPNSFRFDYSSPVTSAVGAYVSFYFYSDGGSFSSSSELVNVDSTQFRYLNSLSQSGVGVFSYDTFNSPSDTAYTIYTEGLTFKGETVGYPDSPVSRFSFGSSMYLSVYGLSNLYMRVTSASLVTTETSAELGTLQDMTDAIIAQNEILSAMYADVIGLLNSIYSRLGDIQAAVDLVNQYLPSVVAHLSNIETATVAIYDLLGLYLGYLKEIAETADDIYAELESFHSDFVSLITTLTSTIMAESDDIQAKMEEIYNLLIAYLDGVFADAIDPGLEDAIAGTDDVMGESDSITQDFTGSMADGWNDLQLDTWAFGAQFLAAFVWVSSWFTNIFNGLGDYAQILLFPLYLGIVMLLIGMISRSSRSAGRVDAEEDYSD